MDYKNQFVGGLMEWTPVSKHPATNPIILKNVCGMDLVQKVLKGRCANCNHVISDDEKQVRELLMKCWKADCGCSRVLSAIMHSVCNLCYDMWHALYHNYSMKDMGYFKKLDEVDQKRRDDDQQGRKRMGM